ncbi:MAG TPA: cation:dicarboxylase symporter family transporter, partial [Chloroflexota bacterium]|nr:cation:dicarboxylase symporter family transporter [Chloroflexota bacterium]
MVSSPLAGTAGDAWRRGRLSVVGPPVAKRGIRAISLPVWILVGAIAGIAAGVALGDRTQILQPFGDAYARMLEMAVYPYILCSLLYGLGRLTPKTAWRLLSTGWCTYVFLWVVTLGSIWLLSLAIPPAPIPSVLTPQVSRPQSDFLALLIPDNLIDSLGRNYVPAVVVFAIFYGIAFQKVERKDSILQVLQTVQVASVTIWSWIVRVAPVGVFALMATAAGTVQPDRLAGLLLYLGLFLIGTVLLAFVVLPMALIAIVPVSYRELMKEMQPALVLALVTTLSVVALPFVMKAAERITARAGCPEDDERADILQANLSVSYVLAQLGNYFVYLLMLYAAYAYRLRLTGAQQLLLPFWTLMSGFGSPTATVDGVKFLASWLGLPPDVLNFFLETWPATRYGQVALSVVGIGFANILVPLVYFHQLRLRPMRAVATGCVAAASIGIVVLGGIFLGSLIAPTADNPRLAFTLDPQLIAGIQAKVQRGAPDGGQDAGSVQGVTVRDIQSSGVLRVGYNPGVMPFSYWNNRGDLVGYDISFAYELARDLNVRLEFIP